MIRHVYTTWAFWGIGYRDLWRAYCAAHHAVWEQAGTAPDIREMRAWVDTLSDDAFAMLTLNATPAAPEVQP